MAASVGNNASNGIEPSFAHSYVRNMIVPGENAKRALRMESLELQRYRELVDADVDTYALPPIFATARSEEHTSELQSLMRISYAVFCLQQKNEHRFEYT